MRLFDVMHNANSRQDAPPRLPCAKKAMSPTKASCVDPDASGCDCGLFADQAVRCALDHAWTGQWVDTGRHLAVTVPGPVLLGRP